MFTLFWVLWASLQLAYTYMHRCFHFDAYIATSLSSSARRRSTGMASGTYCVNHHVAMAHYLLEYYCASKAASQALLSFKNWVCEFKFGLWGYATADQEVLARLAAASIKHLGMPKVLLNE